MLADLSNSLKSERMLSLLWLKTMRRRQVAVRGAACELLCRPVRHKPGNFAKVRRTALP